MRLYKNLAIILTLSILSACSSDGGEPPIADSESYAEGSQGTGVGQNDGAIESGNLDNMSAQQEELVSSIGDRVFFAFNSSDVSAISAQTLDRQAHWLLTNDSITITIEGHCDERGTREFNLALGEKRAVSVKNYLISKGVDTNRIKTISYGKEHPEFLGSNEAAWSKNRRAITVVN